MKKINIQRLSYHIRHRYLTMNNTVIAVAFIIGASWAWGSITTMQRNYGLQKEVDVKYRQLKLAELETQNLAYQKKYYQSSEYQELAVHERLGLVNPGEKVLILPPNSQAAKDLDAAVGAKVTSSIVPASNLEQWMNFLFGGSRRKE